MKTYYVYILSSLTRVLYNGVTSDLKRRPYEHNVNLHAAVPHEPWI
ncbi:MAG: GIY-YIG nuclease family protein [bacterium]|nr:GIY-YIG nuclease family protein [bacterium]